MSDFNRRRAGGARVRRATGADGVSLIALAALAGLTASPALAQDAGEDTITIEGERTAPAAIETDITAGTGAEPGAGAASQSVVSYTPDYFQPYNPTNALDMVSRVPGFSVQQGGNARGYGQNAANVLIDGERPSAKSQDVSDILRRIPVADVVRLDLIRGQVADIDMGGQTVVVNVIRRVSDRSGGTWQLQTAYNNYRRIAQLGGEVSYNTQLLGANVSFGFRAQQFPRGSHRTEWVREPDGDLLQLISLDQAAGPKLGYSGTFAAQRPIGEWTLRLNGRYGEGGFRNRERGDRVEGLFRPRILPVGDLRRYINYDIEDSRFQFDDSSWEIGGDLERRLGEELSLKLIGVANGQENAGGNRFTTYDALGLVQESTSLDNSDSGERIGRGFLTWTPNARNSFEAGAEAAYNFLDAHYGVFLDTGSGPVQVPISIGEALVEEVRGEPYASWLWRPSARLSFDTRVAVEISQIEQTGDAEKSRNFTYPKGAFTATWDVADRRQLRLAVERSVGQLQFSDFVSSVNFNQDIGSEGNPELVPEQSWVLSGTVEQRFWDDAVATLELSREWIEDARGTVPLVGGGEGPGSLGEAERWRVQADVDAPLDRLGLENARLKTSYTYGSSEVIDPVTGETRLLQDGGGGFNGNFNGGGFGRRMLSVDFRKDYPATRVSWGASWRNASASYNYRLNQVTVTQTRGDGFEGFVETTRFFGVNMQLSLQDLGSPYQDRFRYIYAGSRATTPLAVVEQQREDRDWMATFRVRGSF